MAALDLFFFDDKEQELVGQVLTFVAQAQTAWAWQLEHSLDWLGRLARLVVECPELTLHEEGPAADPISALIDRLRVVADRDFELQLPTQAVVGQAFLVAKINFLRTLEAALQAAAAPLELRARTGFELGQSIYSRLAEELFIAIVSDREASRPAQESAARFLYRIWDHRLLDEIDDFAPLLESAWEARNKVRPVLGTMLGSQELFRLFQEARDERFLDYFSRDEISLEQTEAFEEYLFGLAHEEIDRLRAHLRAQHQAALSAAEAARVLGREAPWIREPSLGPDALYASYKQRKLQATYRARTGAPGPTRTAEEYVIVWLLERAK